MTDIAKVVGPTRVSVGIGQEGEAMKYRNKPKKPMPTWLYALAVMVVLTTVVGLYIWLCNLTDGWLFIATLVALMAAGVYGFIYWMVKETRGGKR